LYIEHVAAAEWVGPESIRERQRPGEGSVCGVPMYATFEQQHQRAARSGCSNVLLEEPSGVGTLFATPGGVFQT